MAKREFFPIKRVLGFWRFIAAGFFLCFVSCRPEPPNPSNALRWGMGAEPNTLNPILASDAYAGLINNFVNDTLIERDNDTLQFKPKLATHWEVSPDHLQYTFHLREGVRWHDGKPLTSEDVVYSFERIMDPKVDAPALRSYYEELERVEMLGPHTVRFTYKRPYFLALSFCGGIDILPKHVFNDGGDFNNHPAGRHPIGVGPYRFIEWKTNKKIVLERNPDYWGDKPEIPRIEFVIITDDTIMLQVLKKGELDYSGMRPIQWQKQTGSPKFNALFNRYKYLRPGYQYIGWNAKSPFFSDRRVRQAMTHMVDRQKILQKLKFGLGELTESTFFIHSNTYDPALVPHPYDPALARSLLTEAGWRDTDGDGLLDKDGRAFEFEFLYPAASTDTERLATILKEDLKKIGIHMKILRLEWAAFLNRIEKKEFEATSLSWSTSFEQDPYQLWHSSQAKMDRGSNFVSFENAEADRLMEAARVEFNEEKRNALYRRFQQIIYGEQPYTFLFSNYSLAAVSKRFENVVVHKTGLDPLEWRLARPLPE